MRTAHKLSCIAALLLACRPVDAKATVGNFAISSTECRLSDVVINPPLFNVYLTNATRAGTAFSLSVDGAAVSFDELFAGQGEAVFPVCRLSALSGGLLIIYTAFAPLDPLSPEPAFLPCVITQWSVTNVGSTGSRTLDVSYALVCDPAAGFCNGTADAYAKEGEAYSRAGDMFVGAAVKGSGLVNASAFHCAGSDACAGFRLSIAPGATAHALIAVGYHSLHGRYAPSINSTHDLWRAVADGASALGAGTNAFVGSLPSTGDATTDASVRWFLQAPILLTKGVGGRTITMGYVELNPRDSFWSTWVHLAYWPQLDADMIIECAQAQQEDGKIPTTVLPVILRDDNIDITAYWAVRLARHVQATGNVTLLSYMYAPLCRALAYLKSRDRESVGVPQAIATSFWGDWLDVAYMAGRIFAPHFDLLFLAAVRTGAQMAALAGHAEDAATWADWYAQGYAFVNADFEYVRNATTGNWTTTGLWNASSGCYQDAWADGRAIAWSYADVAVGVFMGVVPADRAASIFSWQTGAGGVQGPFGLRSVYPYQAFSTYAPGTYANGGAYPWFNCVEVSNRYRGGRAAAGRSLFDAHTNNMLYAPDQPLRYTPWEYSHGDTGLDDGNWPQGWDGSCYLRASLGGWGWTRAGAVELHPSGGGRWDASDPFSTGSGEVHHLTLPPSPREGTLPLAHLGAVLRVSTEKGGDGSMCVAAMEVVWRPVASTGPGGYGWDASAACVRADGEVAVGEVGRWHCSAPRGRLIVVVHAALEE
jgi:hypothetical protein